jgi:hypothetical protein
MGLFQKKVIDANNPKGRMKALNRLLAIKPGDSFEFNYAGVRFTVSQIDTIFYTVVDNFGRLHFKGPFITGILEDIFSLTEAELVPKS